MPFVVTYAVYGALPDGNPEDAKALAATAALGELLNSLPPISSIVPCNNTSLGGDPAPENTKHFGALVNGLVFACQEGQTIDFRQGGGPFVGNTVAATGGLAVQFAVYGALNGGDRSKAQAFDVSARLQIELNRTGGKVLINDDLFGDPSKNNKKHFAAVVTRGGVDLYFACAEGQTIDFKS